MTLDDVHSSEWSQHPNSWIDTAFSSSHILLVVFDVTRRESLLECGEMLRRLAQYWKANGERPSVSLVAAKCDVDDGERCVSRSDGEALARMWGVTYHETSAKLRIGIDEAVYDAVREWRRTSAPRSVPPRKRCTVQ